MVDPHVFIFLGSDELQKHRRLELIQKKIFPPGLKYLNYTLLYGDEKDLTLHELKESLACFPTEGAKKRLVVIKMAHRLSKAHQAALSEALETLSDRTVLVLDVPEVKGTQDFVNGFVREKAEVVRFKNEVPVNVFDLGRTMADRRPDIALKILSGLLGHREKAEKILGAIFWQWERLYAVRRLTQEVHKKGLKFILEADRKLKSSSSAYARETLILEALVVRLSYLS